MMMKQRHPYAGFTLIEMLVVIAIVGIIAALVAPSVSQLRRGDLTASGTRQLLDDISWARQLAISHRTTVYMVFVPTNFWQDPAYRNNVNLTTEDRVAATNIAEKQLVGYNYVSLRSVGEQPGRQSPRYLSEWRTLPAGLFIALEKFNTEPALLNKPFHIPPTPPNYKVFGFMTTTNIPFPLATTMEANLDPNGSYDYVKLPYIAFDHLGRLVSEADAAGNLLDAYVPLAQGTVSPFVDTTTRRPALLQAPANASPQVREIPVGNSSNIFNLIQIDQLTGRSRPITREIE